MTRRAGVTIRPARRSDLRQVRAIERSAQRSFLDSPHPEAAGLEPLPLDELRWQLDEGWLFVAADAADRPVAFVGCCLVDGDVFVEEVDVLADYAGQRIGARLLDRVDEAARARGLRRVSLTTFADVPWNAPYYRRLGFRDLPPAEWGPELAARVDEEDESGLDRRARVCLVRDVGA
ncbi:MAG: GNAT family N-acetyltransferase [Gemmatimonadota bacterium]|jgi:GNAT superfamily N-acetyltransferase